jgi:hypothetical protein
MQTQLLVAPSRKISDQMAIDSYKLARKFLQAVNLTLFPPVFSHSTSWSEHLVLTPALSSKFSVVYKGVAQFEQRQELDVSARFKKMA